MDWEMKKGPVKLTAFDKRILKLKKKGLTYDQIGYTLFEAGLNGPSGKPVTTVEVMSRFKYLRRLGRRLGISLEEMG